MQPRIVVGTDFSAAAQAATDRAATLARALGAELLLVSALEVPRLMTQLMPQVALLKQEITSEVRGMLADEVERLGGPELRVWGEVGDGPPAECLADAARDEAVAMVVVGSRGADQQGDEGVGTVPERLMRLCTKPVLVVPLTSQP